MRPRTLFSVECDYVITTTPVEPALAVVAAELRTAAATPPQTVTPLAVP
jgi:hypothetical protein